MKTHEVSNIKKLIKEIKYKLNEIEKLIDKNPKGKKIYPVNDQVIAPRKRNPYSSSD
ncbi:MAG: hypothetical protein JSS91_02150 [Bacteroidetes bacterium]|nr:hypothetical protein [Bacteroidota bacterium]